MECRNFGIPYGTLYNRAIKLALETMQNTINSYITGYHVYKKSWTPTFGEKLEAVIQIDNAADKYAVSIKKGNKLLDTWREVFLEN